MTRTAHGRWGWAGRLLAVASGAVACAHPVPSGPPPAPTSPARIFAYPARDQPPGQQDRDRFECHRWAVRQSGFDPSWPSAAPPPAPLLVPSRPPLADTLAGAATGALIGGVADHSGEGAAIGAAIGGAVGAFSDLHRAHQRHELERALAAQAAAAPAPGHLEYRRALGACLEGRGYALG